MKKFILAKLIIILFVCYGWNTNAQTRYHVTDGKVEFKSAAPMELIEANTVKFAGILDIDKKVFAISIPISTFKGFNSALQQEHFNENYMETAKYPKGIFQGIILSESINFRKNGYYEIKTKGKLELHGIEKVREINCKIKVEGDLVNVRSEFEVLLTDHRIKIPSVVKFKISEKITVIIDANFVLKK